MNSICVVCGSMWFQSGMLTIRQSSSSHWSHGIFRCMVLVTSWTVTSKRGGIKMAFVHRDFASIQYIELFLATEVEQDLLHCWIKYWCRWFGMIDSLGDLQFQWAWRKESDDQVRNHPTGSREQPAARLPLTFGKRHVENQRMDVPLTSKASYLDSRLQRSVHVARIKKKTERGCINISASRCDKIYINCIDIYTTHSSVSI